MPAELSEGETYTVKATTTNMSTKAGVPVAATLTINIAAVVNSQAILEDTKVYGFAAEETHTFEFPMAVPMGAGNKAGAIYAEVLDPNGNKLADGSLDISIAAIGPPSGKILEITWKRWEEVDTWHSISKPMPEMTDITYRFRVKNTGSVTTSFRAAHYVTDYGAGWRYSNPVDINPSEEGYIDWTLWSGKARPAFNFTWYLFADDIQVDSMMVRVRVVE